jgi:hypothetical protein
LRAFASVEHQFRHHEVSILIFGGTGVGLCFGCCPRKKASIMRMLLPQQGHVTRLHRDVPQSRFHRVPGTGHMIHQTATGVVMSAINEAAEDR